MYLRAGKGGKLIGVLSRKLKVAILTDKPQTCTTGMSLIWDSSHCWLSSHQYTVNTPLIVDEFCAPEERKQIYRDNQLRGQTGGTPDQPFLLRLFNSYADSSVNRKPAASYCVLCKAFWGNVTDRSAHFRNTIPASSCSFPMSCWNEVK